MNGMERVIFLFLRRMRAPLILLIVVYAISITGLVLIPGLDDQGQLWHYDFFHAFYFISFTGPTIGFGEIPYPLTTLQRMWVTFAMYLTVTAWLFAIGKILALIQDPAFVRALTEANFIRAVRGIAGPYYIVCGYGEAGSLLVRALTHRGIQCVVIDSDPDRIADLHLDELPMDVPCFCGDASDAQHLHEAGFRRPHCIGVIAVTNSDDANVKIAVASKLVHPELTVICRAESRAAADNMASFNTDHVIDPFEAFAEHLGMTVRTPHINQLHRWLVARPGRRLDPLLSPPRGRWVICGWGRFGRSVGRYLQAEGLEVSVIEQKSDVVEALGDAAPDHLVVGSGTDPEPLHDAGIETAVGVIAGTPVDANNLSIIMTARDINPGVYQIARQNRQTNTPLFEAAGIGFVMQPSRVLVWSILQLVTVPLLSEFLSATRRQDDAWAAALAARIQRITDGMTPAIWSATVNGSDMPAVMHFIEAGHDVELGDLLRDARDREQFHQCIPLLIQRGTEVELLPNLGMSVQTGDRLLFASAPRVAQSINWQMFNVPQFEFMLLSRETPVTVVGQWWARLRRRQRSAAAADTSSRAG